MTTTQPMPSARPPAAQPHPHRRRRSRRAAPQNPWRRRLQNYLRTIFSRGDLSSLLITAALMVVTALALNAAEWTEGLEALAIVSALAVGFGFLLARSHYSELLALIMSSVYSIVAVLIVSALVLVDNGGLIHRTDTLLGQLKTWLVDALAGEQPVNDGFAFVVFLSVLFWYLGHNAAWHIFRVDRVWRVILPTGLVLITNQFYYQGDNSLDIYLIIFVILSLLLLIRSHIDNREYDWFVHRISFPNYVRRAFFQAGGVLALVLVLVAWTAPTGADDKNLDRVKDLLSGDTFYDLAELWNRLFSSLEAEGIATADYYGGEELRLSGAIQLGDQPVMYVNVPPGPRYYWRSTVYDAYDFSSWSWKHIRTVRAYTDNSGLELNIGPTVLGARTTVDQTFMVLLRSSKLVYTAPQPIRLGLPVEIELDCVDDLGRTCVSEKQPSDVAIIRTRETLRAGDSYTVTSSISTASATMLRGAGQNYPSWVTRLYLPANTGNISPRVRELAVQITAASGAVTPYDQAKVIEGWLRTNITYNESIPAPPSGSDPVEWFLFDTRQGYCNYYATAMVLMLRSQGIPARMAAGFAQGDWDDERGAFLVRERDAHTWVEVYFPDYGWVEFEPTADEAPIPREGDQQSMPAQATPTPWPTPTPLPSPTPTSVPPTQESGADTTPTDPASAPFVPATPTPTATPLPTATPPPPIGETRVGGDEENSVLQTALLTLGLFALVILAVIMTILFVIWYVEYRGLSGLNIVERAYARMTIYARWLGLRFDDSATPDERRRYMVSEIPEGEPPINAITQGYVQTRYAPANQDAEFTNSNIAQEAWRDARWVFIRRKIAEFFGREPK
ncbi:MAG: transglutaminase domain-containing protein [Anaerolineae bacterium]|nr:transglutaminase domain-containing protein [Anaerolineae bacterium]